MQAWLAARGVEVTDKNRLAHMIVDGPETPVVPSKDGLALKNKVISWKELVLWFDRIEGVRPLRKRRQIWNEILQDMPDLKEWILGANRAVEGIRPVEDGLSEFHDFLKIQTPS